MRESVLKLAPAKVNLALAVGPADPRNHGMHPICSWMVSVNLYDELEVVRTAPDRLSLYAIQWHDEAVRKSDIDWPITSDLAVRAHRLLEEHTGRSLPVRMKLTKRIPVGGGLGGGSSDAAAMLLACNELFELDLTQEQLLDHARQLGSDVGYALGQQASIVRGLGDEIEPVAHQLLDLVLCVPDAACATGAVYKAFDQVSADGHDGRFDRVERLATRPLEPDALFNDLTEGAYSVCAELRDFTDQIAEIADAPVHMTGSGASLFVTCDNDMHADLLATAIRDRVGIPAVAVRTVDGWPAH